jgi:hypothetical protein
VVGVLNDDLLVGLVSSDVSEEPTVSIFGVTEFGSVSFSCCDLVVVKSLFAGVEGSNTAENMDFCPWCILCGVCG